MDAPDSGPHRTPDGTIRVVVVDDHELVRSGICHALGSAEEIEVVGEAGDGIAALALLEQLEVDVLLLDLHMPRLDGFGVLDAVVARWPGIPVIILTVDENPEVAAEVMRRGAAAYVPKFVKPGDLAALVRQAAGGAVLMGGSRLTAAIAGTGPGGESAELPYGLTQREREVLELLAQGKSNSAIARLLYVSVKTVKYHLTAIFMKLGVSNRTEAAALAINEGLITSRGPAGPRPSSR